MKCQHCGKEIENGSSFCLYCGAKVVPSITCPHCNASIPKGDAFCMSCGWKVDETEISRILKEKEKERIAKETERIAKEKEAAAKKAEMEALEAAKKKERALALFRKAQEEFDAKRFEQALSSIKESLQVESSPEFESLKNQIQESLRSFYKDAIAKSAADKKYSSALKSAQEAQKYFSTEEWLLSLIKEMKKKKKQRMYKWVGFVLLFYIVLVILCMFFPVDNSSIDKSETSALPEETSVEEPEKMEVLSDVPAYEELYERSYHGTIDGKYPVTAKVLYTTHGVYGSYYYDINGADRQLKLDGYFENHGNDLWMVLKEYNEDGKQTGIFYASKYTEDHTIISGTYILESNGKEMPFELSTNEVQSDYSSSYGYAAGERILSESELQVFSQEELRVLRNEIYARHGHIFKSADLSSYFSRFDWYHPDTDNAFNRLSDTEKKNIDIIKSMESSAPSRYLDLASEVVSIK